MCIYRLVDGKNYLFLGLVGLGCTNAHQRATGLTLYFDYKTIYLNSEEFLTVDHKLEMVWAASLLS